ncbi:MAG TPA: RDD family protein [Opitutaceae bacterium]|nr:RDD family protein [Opitutaceae bacterium]
MKSFRILVLFLAAFAAAPAALVAQEETPASAVAPATDEQQAIAPAPEVALEPAAEPGEVEEVEASAVEETVSPAATAEESPPAVAEDAAESDENSAKPDESSEPEKKWVRRNEVVGIGQDVHVKANERAGQVVVIFGNLVMDGMVDGEVVVIGGKAKINGPIKGELVLVLSNGELGPDTSVRGDAVVVGGRLSNPHGVAIGGSTVSIEQHFPQFGVGLDWFRQGLVLGRPMVPSMRMTWIVAGAFLAFYLFLALLLGRAVNVTAATLETRPGGTLLAALLFLPAFPLFILLLAATGIGVLLIPFVMIGAFFAAIFGKVAFLAFVGRAILRPAGENTMGIAVLTTLVGGIVISLLYGIWYLGFALWALTTWIGIGMVLMTILNAVKRERPKVAPAVATPPPTAPTPAAPANSEGAMALSAPVASGLAGSEPGAAAGFVSEPPPAPQPPPLVPPLQPGAAPLGAPVSPVGYERANFGIRLAAILIDTILVGVVVGSIGGGGVFPLFLGVYCALLWFYRGTTVGGIVCGLKVVRLDARPVDFATSIVRTLGAYLSMICVGLGFLWVIWDPEKQTWHDKIAGTTVIRVPKGMSLV